MNRNWNVQASGKPSEKSNNHGNATGYPTFIIINNQQMRKTFFYRDVTLSNLSRSKWANEQKKIKIIHNLVLFDIQFYIDRSFCSETKLKVRKIENYIQSV